MMLQCNDSRRSHACDLMKLLHNSHPESTIHIHRMQIAVRWIFTVMIMSLLQCCQQQRSLWKHIQDVSRAQRKMHTTAMIVPKTHDLMHEVRMSHEVIARHAESRITLADTP